MTTDSAIPAAYQPPSRSSSLGKAHFEGFSGVLAAYDEFYIREDDVASTPSSYRRIRRTKSMLSSRKEDSGLYGTGSDMPENGGEKSTLSEGFLEERASRPVLKAPKSMSFLYGRKDRINVPVKQDHNHDLAVQMARDNFLQQVAQQRIKEQPSFILRPKVRREGKAFRKSVRSSSGTQTYGMPVLGPNQAPKDMGLKTKARNVSLSLKGKIKRLFRRSTDEVERIPDQQVKAERSHVHGLDDSGLKIRDSMTDTSLNSPSERLGPEFTARGETRQSVPTSHLLSSRMGSTQSLGSNDNSESNMKSRVTSWSNTASAQNTLDSRHTMATMTEQERQRLSIIQENGAHYSTSSRGYSRLSNQFSAYPAFQLPSKGRRGSKGSGLETGKGVLVAPVDSARVYSALMKRLDENSPDAKLREAHRKASVQGIGRPTSVPRRTSSAHSLCSNEAERVPSILASEATRASYATSTVRRVTPEEPKLAAHEADQRGMRYSSASEEPDKLHDDIFDPGHAVQSWGKNHSRNISTSHGPSLERLHPPTHSDCSVGEVVMGITTDEVAARKEQEDTTRRVVRESRSSFFPHTSTAIEMVTSPYRRALAATDYKSTDVLGDGPAGTMSSSSSRDRLQDSSLLPMLGNLPDNLPLTRVAYSESVYSRTTGGVFEQATGSAASLFITDQYSKFNVDHQATAATTYRPTPPVHNQLTTSADLKGEQGTWTPTQASPLSLAHDSNISSSPHPRCMQPSMPHTYRHGVGHVIEDTQVTKDDIEIATRIVEKPEQSLGMVQKLPLSLSKPVLKNEVSVLDNGVDTLLPVPEHLTARLRRSRASLRSVRSIDTAKIVSVSAPAGNVDSVGGRPVLQSRNIITPRRTSVRRGSEMMVGQSPGLTVAVEKQFGLVEERTPGSGNENVSPGRASDLSLNDSSWVRDDAEFATGKKRTVGQADDKALGSKRMVDLFLSSRRRWLVGSDESDGAFL